jgi:hypothetical protein
LRRPLLQRSSSRVVAAGWRMTSHLSPTLALECRPLSFHTHATGVLLRPLLPLLPPAVAFRVMLRMLLHQVSERLDQRRRRKCYFVVLISRSSSSHHLLLLLLHHHHHCAYLSIATASFACASVTSCHKNQVNTSFWLQLRRSCLRINKHGGKAAGQPKNINVRLLPYRSSLSVHSPEIDVKCGVQILQGLKMNRGF